MLSQTFIVVLVYINGIVQPLEGAPPQVAPSPILCELAAIAGYSAWKSERREEPLAIGCIETVETPSGLRIANPEQLERLKEIMLHNIKRHPPSEREYFGWKV